jgi:hypothetical protein
MSEVITPVTVIGDSAIGGTATVDSGDISVVAGNLSAVDIVSNNIDSVITDANNIDSINTLAASNSQLLNLNSNLSTIETVNSKLGEINRYYTTFLGSSATDPTVRVDGSPLQVGDMYYSTTMPGMKVRGATAWATSAGGVPVNNSTLTGNTSIQNLTVSNAFNANGYAQFNSSDAFKIPSGTTAQRPSPVSGQLRFNITTGEFEGFNGLVWGGIGGTTSSGGSAGSTAYVRQTFTATAGQTTFTITGGYTPGKIDVFKNGIKLVNGSAVTVTNGASVVLSSGATVGDIIDVVGLASGYFDSPAQPRRLAYTATAGQTLFNVVGGYTPNQLDVFQNGTKLVTGTDVDVSNGTSFTLVTPATAGDTLEIVGFTAADTIAGTLKFQAGTAAAPSITTFEDTDTGVYFPAANTLAVTTNGVQRASIDGSGATSLTGTLGVTGAITASTAVINVGSGQIYKDASGNVGVGTTSPGTKLSVVASANSGINVTNGTMTGIFFNSSDTSIAIGSTSNHPVGLYSNNAERMRIDASGNVGVGTASPSFNTGSGIEVARAGVSTLRLYNTSNTTVGEIRADSVGFNIDGIGATSILRLSTGGGERLRIDNNGNVGVGTTAPSSRLEVIPGGGQGINCVNNGGAGTTNYSIMGQSAGSAFANTGIYANAYNASTNYGVRIVNPPAGASNWAIYSDAGAQSYFAGNVGIGITSPSAKFHVLTANPTAANEVARFQGGTNASDVRNYISLYTTNPDYWWELSNQSSSGTGSANGLAFRERSNAASVERLYIAQGGNVGIGTNSPSYRLHINSGANQPALFESSAVVSVAYFKDAGTSSTPYCGSSGNNFYIGTNANERLRIASAGQIGIGGANYGTSGQVLTSGGASAAPSWTTISTTPADGSITYAKLSTSATEADNVSKRTAKAWVNFNGTLAATSMINGAFNVSSITDYGVGDYEVNFLVSMPDVNYAATCGATSPVNVAHTVTFVASNIRSTYSTGAVAVASFNVTNSGYRADPANVSVIVMR